MADSGDNNDRPSEDNDDRERQARRRAAMRAESRRRVPMYGGVAVLSLIAAVYYAMTRDTPIYGLFLAAAYFGARAIWLHGQTRGDDQAA